MGTAYSARQSSYSDGDTIDASDSNNEFDAIELTIGYRYTLDYVIPWLYF